MSVHSIHAAQAPPDGWFRSEEGKREIDNVLSWQSAEGSWPKNNPSTTTAFVGNPKELKGTFDNGATTTEMRQLARAFRITKDPRCEIAILKGLRHILMAQYPTGGWPQFYPPPATSYHRHITFNDGTMVRIMELLRDVSTNADFAFVPEASRRRSRQAFDRGLACILKCQIVTDGVLTAWCAQHDEVTLEPRSARTFELASLSGGESAGILKLLMSVEHPSAEVRRAVEAGVSWFRSVTIHSTRETKVEGNKVMVNDPASSPLWARFYEIGSNRPIFAGRDGVKKYTLAEIDHERRNGYAWYGRWGDTVLRDYSRWKEMVR
jgi:pectate lyase